MNSKKRIIKREKTRNNLRHNLHSAINFNFLYGKSKINNLFFSRLHFTCSILSFLCKKKFQYNKIVYKTNILSNSKFFSHNVSIKA